LVKTLSQILEVLGIDLKSSEKKLLIFATISIAIVFIAAILLLYTISFLSINIYLKIITVGFVFIFFLFIIYLTISYLLSPMFKTNYLLELLLKDTLHELNIPLSVIKANLQMLNLDEKNDKKLKRLRRIGSACIDLDRLYNDMDYYIKREVRYDVKENFDVQEAVKDIVEKITSQGLNLDIEQNVDTLNVVADKHGFLKILSNLLDNSIKYTKDEKKIQIELKNAKLTITDNGIGMDQGELFKVFDRYYQTNNEQKGSGIGLSIVKAYCDEEKIFINIYSKKDNGTKVTLDLKNILVKEK